MVSSPEEFVYSQPQHFPTLGVARKEKNAAELIGIGSWSDIGDRYVRFWLASAEFGDSNS